MAVTKPQQQLQMIWPRERLHLMPTVDVADGYELRPARSGDEPQFYEVMALAGFTDWNDATLQPWLLKVLPDGWFVVVHNQSGDLVATAMATHNPSGLHPFGGELGWVAAHPAHAGKGLGFAVCAAVTARFLRAGYREIYLKTDDWRLPAIKTYLKLGYVPFFELNRAEHSARWKLVGEKLNWLLPLV